MGNFPRKYTSTRRAHKNRTRRVRIIFYFSFSVAPYISSNLDSSYKRRATWRCAASSTGAQQIRLGRPPAPLRERIFAPVYHEPSLLFSRGRSRVAGPGGAPEPPGEHGRSRISGWGSPPPQKTAWRARVIEPARSLRHDRYYIYYLMR